MPVKRQKRESKQTKKKQRNKNKQETEVTHSCTACVKHAYASILVQRYFKKSAFVRV